VRHSNPIINAFTVDVEDYFHVSNFTDRITPRQWDTYESRVVANTERVLKLLDSHQTRATFFVLGWVADRYPDLVRSIHNAGHEIGCHSFWHRLAYDLTPDEFTEDLLLGRNALEEITAERVIAYRAPSFSITSRSLWALRILAEHEFSYDSSIFPVHHLPVHHHRYGIPNAKRCPHLITFDGRDLWEFPPSVARRLGLNIPISGGGYFRLYPFWITSRGLRQINEVQREPFMFYIHPWELDPDQPRLSASNRTRFRHYVGLRSLEQKLTRLLNRFRFGTLSGSIENRLERPGLPAKNVESSKSALSVG
jgi:polysaccharide deacetylase family protein (PEP-CTERM system associated)